MSTILYRINYVSVLSFSIAHFYCKTYSFTLWDNPENNMAFQVLKDYKVLGRVVFFVQLSSFSPDPFLPRKRQMFIGKPWIINYEWSQFTDFSAAEGAA